MFGWDFQVDAWSIFRRLNLRFVFELVIWPKQVTLVSWTPPLDPWFLWQCFEWNRVNDNLSIVNACHSSLSQITIAHCSFMAVWYPSSISIFNVHIIPLFIVCLSAWVTFLLLHKFLPSLPPLKNSWIFLFTTWLPIFGPAAAFPQRVRALKNVKDILQLLHLSRRQQSRHDLFGRFCMRQDQQTKQFLSSCSAQRKIVRATQNSPSRLGQLDTCHTSLAM